MQLQKFYRKFDVYWQMIFILIILASFGIFKYGFQNTLPQLLSAVSVAAVSDFVIKKFIFKIKIFPKSAIISGLFIGILLNVGIVWYAPAIASMLAMLVKNFIRFDKKNIFNPAAIGVLLILFLFPNSSAWWGGEQLIPILILGIWMLYRIKRIQMVAIFLASYALIFSVYYSSIFNISSIQNIFLNPTLLFFSFFMLTEHKTNPLTSKGRMIYAPISAALSFASLIFLPQYNFILGLVASNLVSVLLNKFVRK